MENLQYEERLRHLRLMNLDTRRIRGDLIELFKILNDGYRIDSDLFFIYNTGDRRGHSKKLFKRRSRLDSRKYVFRNRILHKWNSLPEFCNCMTLNNFKSHVLIVLQLETD